MFTPLHHAIYALVIIIIVHVILQDLIRYDHGNISNHGSHYNLFCHPSIIIIIAMQALKTLQVMVPSNLLWQWHEVKTWMV